MASNIQIPREEFIKRLQKNPLTVTGNILKTGEEQIPSQLAQMKLEKQEKKLLEYQIKTKRGNVNEFLLNKYSKGQFNSAELDGYDNTKQRFENGISLEYRIYFPMKESTNRPNSKYVITDEIVDKNTGDSYFYHIPITIFTQNGTTKYKTDYGEILKNDGTSESKDGIVYSLNELKKFLQGKEKNIPSIAYVNLEHFGFIKSDGEINLAIENNFLVETYLKNIDEKNRHNAIIYINKVFENDDEKESAEKLEKELQEVPLNQSQLNSKIDAAKKELEEIAGDLQNDEDIRKEIDNYISQIKDESHLLKGYSEAKELFKEAVHIKKEERYQSLKVLVKEVKEVTGKKYKFPKKEEITLSQIDAGIERMKRKIKEAKEKLEKEAQEKLEKEAQEAKEKLEKEAQEAKEKLEKEAQEKEAKEAKEKEVQEISVGKDQLKDQIKRANRHFVDHEFKYEEGDTSEILKEKASKLKNLISEHDEKWKDKLETVNEKIESINNEDLKEDFRENIEKIKKYDLYSLSKFELDIIEKLKAPKQELLDDEDVKVEIVNPNDPLEITLDYKLDPNKKFKQKDMNDRTYKFVFDERTGRGKYDKNMKPTEFTFFLANSKRYIIIDFSYYGNLDRIWNSKSTGERVAESTILTFNEAVDKNQIKFIGSSKQPARNNEYRKDILNFQNNLRLPEFNQFIKDIKDNKIDKKVAKEVIVNPDK